MSFFVIFSTIWQIYFLFSSCPEFFGEPADPLSEVCAWMSVSLREGVTLSALGGGINFKVNGEQTLTFPAVILKFLFFPPLQGSSSSSLLWNRDLQVSRKVLSLELDPRRRETWDGQPTVNSVFQMWIRCRVRLEDRTWSSMMWWCFVLRAAGGPGCRCLGRARMLLCRLSVELLCTGNPTPSLKNLRIQVRLNFLQAPLQLLSRVSRSPGVFSLWLEQHPCMIWPYHRVCPHLNFDL